MNFPRDKNHYILADDGAAATIRKAKCVNPETGEETLVGIKTFEIQNEDVYFLTTKLRKLLALDHENIVNIHCSFMADDRLWVVMSPPGTPLSSILGSSFPRGLPEKTVIFILRETLKAVHYMHARNEACGNIGAESVCLDDDGKLRVGMRSYDPTMSGFLSELGDGGSLTEDVRTFGLLALELFYGSIPSSSDEVKSLVADAFVTGFRRFRVKASRFFGRERSLIPAALAEVVAACLDGDENARPTMSELMEFRFFQKNVSDKWSLQKLMNKRT